MVSELPRPPEAPGATAFRPRWWALLSVSLGLMALVVASSHADRPPPTADASGRTRRPVAPPHHLADHPVGSPASRSEPPTSATPTISARPTTPGVSPDFPPAVAMASPPSNAPAGGRSATATTATATTATTTTAATAPEGPPGQPVTPATLPTPGASSGGGTDRWSSQPGNLEFPDNVSATYPLASGGGVTASATWTGAPALELSVDCPGGQSGRTGPSGLAVSVAGPAGACTVTLAEPAGIEATVAYTLDLQYPGT